jgi:carbon storage regulator
MNKDDYGNLSLTRRNGESIVIGDEIVISVVEVQGGRVRLFIKAPKGVKIQRLEIVSEDNPIHQIVRA